jgi:5'-methylthioadenosine phosphorylase
MNTRAVLGIIGGSGLYEMPELSDVERVELDTPFGQPSGPITLGTLDGTRLAFIARHGIGHRLLPSEVPYRANIFALKLLGVERVLAVSAVGSLREEYAPLDLVVPDQLFDRTKNRLSTFFGNGIVAHVGFAQPFCPALSEVVFAAAQQAPARAHRGGTLVTMEGPAFSTIAESETYRRLGFALIGMTALPEAKLAREAELCYAILAMVTDYDVWHLLYETVTSDMVMANLQRNVTVARGVIREVAGHLDQIGHCTCRSALADAIVTPLELVPEATRMALDPIIGKYLRSSVGATEGE